MVRLCLWYPHSAWLVLSIYTAVAIVALITVGATEGVRRLSPVTKRILELVDGAAIAAVIPLLLWIAERLRRLAESAVLGHRVTTLKVDPGVLHSAGTSFGQAADGLGSLQADASLADAAAAVPSLSIAVASQAAQSDVASETAALADGARRFGENLGTAARWYEKRDQAAAEAIKKIGSASAAGR